MDREIVSLMMNRFADLAAGKQQPLIILENPQYTNARETNSDKLRLISRYVLTIGNAAVPFDGFSPAEMIDTYGIIVSRLAQEDAVNALKAENAKST